jgi:hypothetical protein
VPYRLNRSIMVLALKDNHQAAVPIPAGRMVHVTPSPDDDRFVIVKVDGQKFLAFASDLIGKGPVSDQPQRQSA